MSGVRKIPAFWNRNGIIRAIGEVFEGGYSPAQAVRWYIRPSRRQRGSAGSPRMSGRKFSGFVEGAEQRKKEQGGRRYKGEVIPFILLIRF